MGTWGTALFSDDLAVDLRDDFRDLIGEGLTPEAATDLLLGRYSSSIDDSDEGPVFWLALAAAQWKLGRLDDRVKTQALRIIHEGTDLAQWDAAPDRQKRQAVLEKLRDELLTTPPAPKNVSRRVISNTDWKTGELIGFQLLSKQWTILRVIGHHRDKGGFYAVCELLDWSGTEFPEKRVLNALPIRKGGHGNRMSQFMFCQPNAEKDQMRIRRLGISSTPSQKCGGYTVVLWKRVDIQFLKMFSLQ